MINLEVVSPVSFYTEKIIWIECDTSVGNLVIKENHTPVIFSVLDGSSIIYGLPNGKIENLSVKNCLINFKDNHITIITDELK
jgi:F0F1-type ATP synthase epsilon subunit